MTLPRKSLRFSAMALVAASGLLSACASKPPENLPPEPGPAVTTTNNAPVLRGPMPGSQADFQASLMEKLAPVELELGYTPPQIPLDFSQRAHQDWFRLMSWYLTEEIVETLTAKPEEVSGELADCLHFAIELCILAGITGEKARGQLWAADQMNLFADFLEAHTLQDVLVDLGKAVNLMKAKHWKRNPQPTDAETVQLHLHNMLYKLIRVIRGHDLEPETIYMAKHKTNEDRIQARY